MANFFKDYQNAIKTKRLDEIRKEQERKQHEEKIQNYIDGLKVGQKVKYSFLVDTITNKPIIYSGYFVSSCVSHVWVSKTRQDALNGYGRTISKTSIIIK